MLEAHDVLVAGRYYLLHRLRRGGMSEVFLALDEQTQQQVALKLVSIMSPDCFQRLKREVRVQGKLSHQHILPILDDGEWEGYAYLVMPYIKDGSLRDLLMNGPLSQEETGTILTQIAAALQCAHDHGIFHRDIKASNILLDRLTDNAVYLADFGLASSPAEGSDTTQTGYLIGTPEYIAPELIAMPESASSDIYALGILLYRMLTGRFPFTGASPIEIYWKHVEDKPPPPRSFNQAISPEVEAVILRAIDKDPARRFPGAQVMAEAYQQALLFSRLPPAQVRVSRVALRPTRSLALTRAGHRLLRQRIKRKSLLAAVAFLLLSTSISLGFLAGHTGTQTAVIANSNVQSVEKAWQPVSPPRVDPPVQSGSSVTPTPTVTHKPVVSHPPSPTPSAPPKQVLASSHTNSPIRHPKHHKHHRKHRDG